MSLHAYYVTCLWRGQEVNLWIEAATKDGARAECRRLHPGCHIVHVELGAERV